MSGLQIQFTGIQRQYNALRTQILDVTDSVLRSGRLMSGNYTAEFEAWLAKCNGVKYAVTCHSGTQALEIVAEFHAQSITIRPPRVLLPAMSFPATANAFARTGWQVDFVDVDRYGQMNFDKIDRTQSMQAICAVGLYGQASKADRAAFYCSLVIEDGAQHWLANNCTRHGHATAVSFDPTKNLANFGNGGAVLTQDRQLADFARDWVWHGKRNGHSTPGSNSRMSEIDCAQMLVKVQHLDSWQARRAKIAEHWIKVLKSTKIRSLIDQTNCESHCFHKFVIDVDNRDDLAKDLKLAGIDTRIHYDRALWELPAYQTNKTQHGLFSVAASLSRRCLSLPFYPELTDLEVEYIIDKVLALAS